MTARHPARWPWLLCVALLAAGGLAATGCATPAAENELVEQLEREGLRTRRTERGLVLYLPDVLFRFDSDELTVPARQKISTVASLIVRLAPGRTVSVEGHSDALGSEPYNRSLSLRRARAVEHELVSGGVEGDRTVMVGYGERFPIAPNEHPDGQDNPEGRSKNRRVEVVIETGS